MSDLTLRPFVWMEVQMYRLGQAINDEGGLETVEVAALIGVMLALLIVVMKAIESSGQEKIGETFLDKLQEWIGNLGTKSG